MDVATCRQHLAASPVAHLATVGDDGRPHIVPIVFAVDSDVIFFGVDQKPKRTRLLQRLRNITRNPAVAVLADHYEDNWTKLWWVRADGTATVLESGEKADRAIGFLMRRYPQYRHMPPQGPFVSVAVERWSGWSAS